MTDKDIVEAEWRIEAVTKALKNVDAIKSDEEVNNLIKAITNKRGEIIPKKLAVQVGIATEKFSRTNRSAVALFVFSRLF